MADPADSSASHSPSFALGHVPGVIPDKWVRIWGQRYPEVPLDLVQTPSAAAERLVREREADAALLRLPIEPEGLHAIPLYTETSVVVVPKEHFTAAADELSPADIADEIVLHPLDDVLDWSSHGQEQPPGRPAIERPATTADAVQLAAAGVGLLVVPQSLARLHHRKDLVYRPLSDVPESRVALSWIEGETTDLMEQFIGVVRGRTPNSTRGRQAEPGGRGKTGTPAAQKPAAGKTSRKPTGGKPAAGARKPRGGGPKPGSRGKPRRR